MLMSGERSSLGCAGVELPKGSLQRARAANDLLMRLAVVLFWPRTLLVRDLGKETRIVTNTHVELIEKIQAAEERFPGDETRLQQLHTLRRRVEEEVQQHGSPPPEAFVVRLLSMIEAGTLPTVEQVIEAVEIGDEADEDEDTDDEDGPKCPMCGEPLINFCSHFIGGGFDFYECREDFSSELGFNDSVDELYWLVQEFEDDDEGFDAVVSEAPEDLRELLQSVREEGFYYWTDYEDVSSRHLISGPGHSEHDYFHPDAKSFAKKVEKEAERAISWLKERVPGLADEDE